MTENYSSPCGGSQAQVALQFIPRQHRLAVVLYKVKLSVSSCGKIKTLMETLICI
jgi:hypothetical protein